MDYSDCSVRIDILSSSWNAWLILEISKGIVRPCDLQRSISVARKRVLTKQLGELERMEDLGKESISGFAFESRIFINRNRSQINPNY